MEYILLSGYGFKFLTEDEKSTIKEIRKSIIDKPFNFTTGEFVKSSYLFY
jgi:hypothetical protein